MAGPLKPNDPDRRNDQSGDDDKKRSPLGFFSIVLWAVLLVFLLQTCRSSLENAAVQVVPYSTFYEWVDKGYVAEVELESERPVQPVRPPGPAKRRQQLHQVPGGPGE